MTRHNSYVLSALCAPVSRVDLCLWPGLCACGLCMCDESSLRNIRVLSVVLLYIQKYAKHFTLSTIHAIRTACSGRTELAAGCRAETLRQHELRAFWQSATGKHDEGSEFPSADRLNESTARGCESTKGCEGCWTCH